MKIIKPTLKDISKIQNLLTPFIKDGIILKRDDDEVATNIRSYIAIKKDDKFIAIGALHIFSKELGEIRSLAVNRNYQRQGLGKKIVKKLEKEAKSLGLTKLLTLTYQKEFFESLGFKEIPKEEVPSQKVWSDCIKCPHFPNCNEISLIKTI
jgi:amino-acid N-acetyltransferase